MKVINYSEELKLTIKKGMHDNLCWNIIGFDIVTKD